MIGVLRFTKMQALGNDYIYIDAITQTVPEPERLAKAICSRHYGVGSDGLVLICPSLHADFRMRIFNRDGSEAEMCGNALRSTAKFLYHYGFTTKTELELETLGGVKTLWLELSGGAVCNITADIGPPILDAARVPVLTDRPAFIARPVTLGDMIVPATAMSLGNPHCAVQVTDVYALNLKKYGPLLECSPLFPQKCNAEFFEVLSETRLRLRTWERNTGETLACGTGSCAAVVAGALSGLCAWACAVEQPGGVIHVRWDSESGHLLMKAPSEIVFEGVWRLEGHEASGADRRRGLRRSAGRA